MNNVWLDIFTSFPVDVRGRILVMNHCSSYLFSHGFGLFNNLLLYLFTNLLLLYLYFLLSPKMLVALWPSLKIICLLFGVVGIKRRNI